MLQYNNSKSSFLQLLDSVALGTIALSLACLIIKGIDPPQTGERVSTASLQSYTSFFEQRLNSIAQKQDQMSNDMEGRTRILESRIGLLRGRCQ
ncbi:hypothetical protein D9M71_451600 [compost metagenome]